MPEKTLLPISPSVLVTVYWINEKASNLIPLIATFNLGGKKRSADAKSREQGGWDNMGIWRFAKNLDTKPEECANALSCRRYQDPFS
jgi:hypothetical protein